MTAPLTPAPQPRAEQARFAINLIFLLVGLLNATWAVNIPAVRDALHLSASQLGLALLSVGVGSLLSMPLTGRLTARYGSHRLTLWLGVATALALIPPFFAPGLYSLMACLLLLGMVMGALDVTMNAQGVTVEQALGRPIMSRLHAYFSLGGVLGSGLGALLVGHIPTIWHGMGVALLGLVVMVWAGNLLLPDQATSPTDAASPAATTDTAASNPGQNSSNGQSYSTAVALLGSLCFLGMLAEGANYDWAALYFKDVLHTSLGLASLAYAAFVAAMTLGRWFGDRLRARLSDEVMVRGGALVTALGLGLALLLPHPVSALLGFALSGLGLSNVVPVMYGTAGHALAGRGIATVATIGYGGFLLGPPLIGFVAQHYGLGRALGLAALAALLVAALGAQAFALVRRAESKQAGV